MNDRNILACPGEAVCASLSRLISTKNSLEHDLSCEGYRASISELRGSLCANLCQRVNLLILLWKIIHNQQKKSREEKEKPKL